MMTDSAISFADKVRVQAQRLTVDGLCALGGLFDLTSLRLVRLAVTITRNQHDGEDAVQAVLVRVADRPQLLATADCPWSYLLKMVRNESLNVRRKRRRLTLLDDLAELLTWCRVDDLEQEEQFRAVWRVLRRLPTEQSEVVVLKIWEELTFSQIAEVLGISPNTAASRYRYAMEKMSGRLRGWRTEVSRHE